MTHEFEVMQKNPQQRYDYLIGEVNQTGTLWILTDEDGCVMLNADEQDCVPVWPSEAMAKQWADGEWSTCTPHAIALKDWLDKWTDGLAGDNVDVAVFPNPGEDGLVISSDEFDFALTNGKS